MRMKNIAVQEIESQLLIGSEFKNNCNIEIKGRNEE